MEAIIAAIDHELAEVEKRAEQLRQLRAQAAELEGGDVPEAAERSAPAAKPTPPALSKQRATQSNGSDPIEAACDEIVDVLLARPGEWLRAGQIQSPTGLKGARWRDAVARCLADGRVKKIGRLGTTRYLHADDPTPEPALKPAGTGRPSLRPATKPDEVGAKTKLERQVVEAVFSVELTQKEISAKTGLPIPRVQEILAGLISRHVVEREGNGPKALYGRPAPRL